MSGWDLKEEDLFTAASCEPTPDEAGSRNEKIGLSNATILSPSQRSNSDDEDANTKITVQTNTVDCNAISTVETRTTDLHATTGQLVVEAKASSNYSHKDLHIRQKNRGSNNSSNSTKTSLITPSGRGASNALIALRGPPRSSPDSSDIAFLGQGSNRNNNRSPVNSNSNPNPTTINNNPVKTYGNNRHTTKTVNRLVADWEAAAAAEHGLHPRALTDTGITNTNTCSPVKNTDYPYSKPTAFVPRSTYSTFNTTPNSTSNTTSGGARSARKESLTTKRVTKRVNEVVDLLSDDEQEADGVTKRRRMDQSDTTEQPKAPTPHAYSGTSGPSSSTTATPALNAANAATTATSTTTATTATSSTALLSSPPPLSSTQEYAVWQAKRDKDIAEIKNTLRDKELCALLSASEIDLLKSRLVQLMLQ